MCVLVSLGVAGWLALAPATAKAQRSRAIAQAAVNQYLNGGYGGYGVAYGYPRPYGGYSTPYGGSYPIYGYNNAGYGYRYGGGYPAYGYGIRRSAFGNAMVYGGGGYRQGFYYNDD
jgi:hypothetical protein